MKIEINNKECKIYLLSHFNDVIKKELSNKFETEKEIYDFLLNQYNEILANSNRVNYEEDFFTKSKDVTEKIFSLICQIESTDNFVLYETINRIAKERGFLYLQLFILLDYKQKYKKEMSMEQLSLFSKDDVIFATELLREAYEAGLLVDHKGLSSIIHSAIRKEGGVSNFKEKNEMKSFIENLEELANKGEMDYLSISDEDLESTYVSFYKKKNKTNYKDILLSDDFREYLKKSDFDNEHIEDFEDFIIEYIEESGSIDFKDLTCKHILEKGNKDVVITKDDVVNLEIESEYLF